MKITKLETFPCSIPYRRDEVSTRIVRGGVTNVVVKLTTDTGLVGWGESCSGADTRSIEETVKAAKPFVIGRNPWDTEQIAHDFFVKGIWYFRINSANFAYSGIDMALWDLCGKACGQPLYKLFGGARRNSVNYFCYLTHDKPEGMAQQVKEGLARGYSVFYVKVGIDEKMETEMLRVIRKLIGPDRKLRVDSNEIWTVAQAVRWLKPWHAEFNFDFVEAPVPIQPVENMQEVRRLVGCPIAANEGLGSEQDTLRVIRSRCCDFLCYSPHWVGTLRRFHTLCQVAALEGLQICKHVHGEFGIAQAASHHLLLTLPNVTDGSQSTLGITEDDILKDPSPLTTGADWGLIDKPGLGVEVDEAKLQKYHQAYLRDGQFMPYKLD